jgi:hypothetical protein
MQITFTKSIIRITQKQEYQTFRYSMFPVFYCMLYSESKAYHATLRKQQVSFLVHTQAEELDAYPVKSGWHIMHTFVSQWHCLENSLHRKTFPLHFSQLSACNVHMHTCLLPRRYLVAFPSAFQWTCYKWCRYSVTNAYVYWQIKWHLHQCSHKLGMTDVEMTLCYFFLYS